MNTFNYLLLKELQSLKDRIKKTDAALYNAKSEIEEIRDYVFLNGITISNYDGYNTAIKIIDKYIQEGEK